MRTVTRGELTFDVVEHGPADGDPVLLLHGFPQHASSWAGVASRLAGRGYRCVAPDQRGYSPGARPAGARAYVVDELVADALAVLDDVAGPDGRAHVVGHDWGAAVAWALAGRHPDRLRSLTAVSVPPPAAMLRAMRRGRQALASWYMLAFQVPGLAERGLAGSRFATMLRRSGQSAPAAERDAAAMAEDGALTAALNWYRAMRFARGGSPGRVRVPTLFVWSDGDTAITRDAALLADRYVEAPFRFVELRGVSHWVPDQAPAQLAELIAEHLAAYPS
ncbi:alpha/beta fold hydrolase [Pseudonocardia lacus]|uniref:alpha/beta fold hydrolase n=1 Tax=Pseudonocardia lacus TaxID=2835865 RepID=UPI0027E36586|nr:alpha/beta fold hydrolase [Pseudonocardia lacus]